jgi:DNA-binding MarR family transcriptional regulator
VSSKKKFAPDKGRLSESELRQTAYVGLLRASDRIKTLFEAVVAPFDLTGQQYNVLRILRSAKSDGLPTLTIAERMIERAPGITRMIDRLEAKGLVARELRADDRRYVYCRITEKGLSLLETLDDQVEEFNRAAFRGLDSEELEQIAALLEKSGKAHESK